jgi:hypothetical protein
VKKPGWYLAQAVFAFDHVTLDLLDKIPGFNDGYLDAYDRSVRKERERDTGVVMKHEIKVYGSWCNNGTADLSVYCNTCSKFLAQVNSDEEPGELPVERLAEIAAEHREGMTIS